MNLVLERAGFLAPPEHRLIIDLLENSDLKWRSSTDLGRAAAGESLQLATRSEHMRPAMRQVASLVASRVFDALKVAALGVPPEEETTPQVFPVKMSGNPDRPPCQAPHTDKSAMGVPKLTCLYYPIVSDAFGGALVLHSEGGEPAARYWPSANCLIVISGSVTHSVDPLTRGRRVTVVVNYYW